MPAGPASVTTVWSSSNDDATAVASRTSVRPFDTIDTWFDATPNRDAGGTSNSSTYSNDPTDRSPMRRAAATRNAPSRNSWWFPYTVDVSRRTAR